jgi:capsular polysaccharide biosynthesis protein
VTIRRRTGRILRRPRAPRLASYVDPLVPLLTDAPTALVVVLLDREDDAFSEALARRLPAARIRVFSRRSRRKDPPAGSVRRDTWSTPDDVLAALRASDPPGAIIDATSSGGRFALLRDTVWALPDGGVYVAIAPGSRWEADVRSAGTERPDQSDVANRRRRELAESFELVSSAGNLVTLRKHRTHHFMLRHTAVEQTFGARFGPDWGEIVALREAYDFESRAHLVMHGEPAPREKPSTITVPALALRRYHDVTCHVREVMTRDNLILPDSFRHWQSSRLFHKKIFPSSTWFGRLDDSITRATVRHEAGEFFAFDSAFPMHFGHVTTETISRYWGWKIARAHNPGLRAVMTHQPRKDRLPSWKAQILEALDIPTDDILWVTQEESVEVDSLVAAMPQLENPFYIDRDITQTWADLYAGLGPDPEPGARPEKIFLSRRAGTQRYCTNTPEIEALMADQGFTILFPEKMSYPEQAHTFRAAKVIAGFAGSGLYNMMFNPSAKVVVLTSQNYVAANEYLLASAGGNEIHYFWAPALVEAPSRGFSVDAYRSDFEFPLEQHRDALLRVLA